MTNSLQHFRNDEQGLEIIINTQNGASFLSESGIARVFQIPRSTLRDYCDRMRKTMTKSLGKKASILTNKGRRAATIYDEHEILYLVKALKGYNPFEILGLRAGLHALAGFQISSNVVQKPDANIRSLPTNYLEALKELTIEVEQHEQTKLLLEVAEEKADKLDRIEQASGLIQIDDFARVTYTTFGMGRNNLIKCLRFLGIYVPDTSKPYQRYLDSGYFCDRIVVNGVERIFAVPRLTGKGVVWLESYIFDRLVTDNLYRFSNAKSAVWKDKVMSDQALVKNAPAPKEYDFIIYSVS